MSMQRHETLKLYHVLLSQVQKYLSLLRQVSTSTSGVMTSARFRRRTVRSFLQFTPLMAEADFSLNFRSTCLDLHVCLCAMILEDLRFDVDSLHSGELLGSNQDSPQYMVSLIHMQ